MYFVDEAAFLEHPELVERSLSQTTTCRIWVSTPNGIGNPFYQRRFGGACSVFTFRWQDDPRKGPEWYEEQRRRLDPVTLAQEVDIDYTASIEGIVIPAEWVRAATGATLTDQDGEPYEARGPVVCGYDPAGGGKALNAVAVRQGACVLAVHSWPGEATEGIWRAIQIAEDAGAEVLIYDAQGPGADIAQALAKATRRPKCRVVGVNGGASPGKAVWPDGRHADEIFLNERARDWWTLRERFRKTHEWSQGAKHRPEELISIPDRSTLAQELSVPLAETTETGKLKVESKNKMAVRGVASPNEADALTLTFADVPPLAAPWGVRVERVTV